MSDNSSSTHRLNFETTYVQSKSIITMPVIQLLKQMNLQTKANYNGMPRRTGAAIEFPTDGTKSPRRTSALVNM
jgi:hypothetical protein